jgi:hypothetical protein
MLGNAPKNMTDHLVLATTLSFPITIDGGMEHPHGAFGWALKIPQHTKKLQGNGAVDSGPEAQSSTRAELGGLLAMLTYLCLLTQYYPRTSTKPHLPSTAIANRH